MPVVLGEAVFDADDGEAFDQCGIIIHKFGAGKLSSFPEEIILAIVVELAGSRVKGDPALIAGLIAGGLDGVENHLHRSSIRG